MKVNDLARSGCGRRQRQQGEREGKERAGEWHGPLSFPYAVFRAPQELPGEAQRLLKAMKMKSVHTFALTLTIAIATFAAPHAIAATPTPHPKIMVHLPNTPLHTEFVVEVNAKGQIVRVEKGKSCKVLSFNAQTYGNVLQMWIRHPDGTAEVGRYLVTYDYDPKTKMVTRNPTLLSRGGNWGNKVGAADDMMDEAQKETAKYYQDQGKSLPPLENIVGPTAAPSPHA